MGKKPSLSNSDHAYAWSLYQAGKLLDAKRVYKKICRKWPSDEGAWLMVGIIQGGGGDYKQAEIALKKVIALNPDNFDALANLGLLFFRRGDLDTALKYYLRALSFQPDHIDVLTNSGNVYAQLDMLSSAEENYLKAIEQNPNYPAALTNLANVLAYQGRPLEAIPFYRRALQIDSESVGVHSNLLLCMHYPFGFKEQDIYAEHRKWAELYCRGISPFSWVVADIEKEKRLRIGFVTPDLRGHSVAYFLEPILRHYNKKIFEIYCYFEDGRQDQKTNSLERLSDVVVKTQGLSDLQVAEKIKKDKIDILIDLAGHTENNRLVVFAYQPAPLQITYLGYPDTTGLETIHYRITDQWADPVGQTEAFHSERLLRLKRGFLCFSPAVESPEVSALPYDENGYITFGSFNVLTKLTPKILSLWAKILILQPTSRIIIKNRQLSDEVLKDRLLGYFQGLGVEPDRIELLGKLPKAEHMSSYSRVDIALDSYPYNGTTTTCDTLWMGVPVVTLAGKMHVSRVGVSILSQLALHDLVAENEGDYVQLVLKLASNIERIRSLRINLRGQMRASHLCDGVAFCQDFEDALISAWHEVLSR